MYDTVSATLSADEVGPITLVRPGLDGQPFAARPRAQPGPADDEAASVPINGSLAVAETPDLDAMLAELASASALLASATQSDAQLRRVALQDLERYGATTGAFVSVSWKSGLAARARSTNRAIPG